MQTFTLKDLSKILKSDVPQSIPKKSLFFRKFFASITLASFDIVLLIVSMLASIYLRNVITGGNISFVEYLPLMLMVVPLFPLAYSLRGMYPGFGIDVIAEMRTMTFSTTAVFAVVATMAFFIHGDWEYSRLVFLLSWAVSLVFLPLGRAFIRKFIASKNWWGIPVIVIGAGQAGGKVIHSLKKHSYIGYRPIVAIDDDIDRWGYIDKIPVAGGLEIIPELADKLHVDHAIIAMPMVSNKRQNEIIKKYAKCFTHTTVIPNLFGLSSLWVAPRDLGGILGLEVQQKLLHKAALLRKRIFDILLASVLCILVSPLIAIVSAMIYFDSKGKIFFRQKRMGLNDTRFEIIKFRTMHVDAEQRLTALLESDPELKQEYEIYHKLRNDPRLTRVGVFLRKFSLDELPQFWNVIKGEMSLIGPRAYMPWEKMKMKGNDEIILKVKPGISGLWQVTDRNASSFEERNQTDVYYIRNWSMFLDFWILARTIAVVITGNSGY